MSVPESLDPEQRNIIDKLANFVARNGPQFEEMTKHKQRDNPKFAFLFGGEFYTYYKFRVASEIAQINQRNQQHLQQQQQQEQQHQHLQQQQQQQEQHHQMMGGQPPQILPLMQAQPQWPQQQQPGPGPMGQQQQLPPPQPGPPMGQPPPPQQQQQQQSQAPAQLQDNIAQAQAQVSQLQTNVQEQVKQSEANLAAQYTVLMQQQQNQIQEMIVKTLDDKLNQQLQQCELVERDVDTVVQPIIDSCTKDAILAGKNWIMQRMSSETFCDAISQYLLKRITAKEAPFQLRLHLIYLINDVMHHCVRRNIESLRTALERVVVPIFCTSSLSSDQDKIQKLNKLLDLWDRNKYFGVDTLEKMKDPSQALSSYQANLITENAGAVTAITSGIQQQYSSLEKQHQDFCNHLNTQLATAQAQLQLLLNQDATTQPSGPAASSESKISQTLVALAASSGPISFPASNSADHGGGFGQNGGVYGGAGSAPPPIQQFDYNHGSGVASWRDSNDPEMPPGGPGMLSMPDFSKPPPGFPPLPGQGGGPPAQGLPHPGPHSSPHPGPSLGPPLGPHLGPHPGLHPGPLPPPLMPPPSELDLTPSVPYYELPAGLIAPLIRLEDFEYKPLDPNDIRLPPPMPPSERLLAAVEAFYEPPSRERPRDGDGWEKLGLYEFFRAKQRARRMKEEGRGSSRSPSPPRRRFNSEERIPSRRSRSPSGSNSRSPSRSPSSSRSRSPRRSRSRSRSRSQSPLPYIRTSRSRSHTPPTSSGGLSIPPPSGPPVPLMSKTVMPRPRSGRSPTPPAFAGSFAQVPAETRLGEENKGHQLLKKMGWGGRGLGAGEQGIVDPVEAADVRDRQDVHKGIGIDLRDPFEQFRKNKSQGFITRMKARDDERPNKKKSRFND